MLGLGLYHAEMAVAHLTCGLIAGLAVATRIYVKTSTKQGLNPDDHLILLTLLLYYIALITVLQESFTNFGPYSKSEVQAMTRNEFLPRLGAYRKAMLTAFLLALTAQYTCKLSILLFYRRIFSTSIFHLRASLAVTIFASLWYIAATLSTLCICLPLTFMSRPPEASYLTAEREKFSGDWMPIIHSMLIVDTITDFVILLLPIRTAFTLQIARRARVALAGVFALGGFVVVTNVVKIVVFYSKHNVDPDEIFYHYSELSTTIHICTAVLCASIPIFRPLWTSMSGKVRTIVTGLRKSENEERDSFPLSKMGAN